LQINLTVKVIWNMLEGNNPSIKLVDSLVLKSNGSYEMISRYVTALVAELDRKGILFGIKSV